MINACIGIGYAAAVVYGMLVDGAYWKIYCCILVCYLTFVTLTRETRDNPKRKTLTIATWNEASDPTSYMIIDLNVQKSLEYVAKLN